MLEKLMSFAEKGKGRRLLNTLNKGIHGLEPGRLDEVLRVYRDIGLAKEVESLKTRRGILGDEKYNALAKEVKNYCYSETYEQFASSLRNMLTSGMKMNPAKMDPEDPKDQGKY